MKNRILKVCMLAVITSLGIKVQAQTTLTVTNKSDTGVGSLRQAASDAMSGDIIRFDPALLTTGVDSISLTTEIDFEKKAITIIGLYTAKDTLYISGAMSSRIFSFNLAGKVVLDSLVLINGNSIGTDISGFGGAVSYYKGKDTLHINNCIFSGNTATKSGGAISAYSNVSSSSIEVDNSIFIGNMATKHGGGVYSYSTSFSSVNVSNSIISDNTASVDGGGIHAAAASSTSYTFTSVFVSNSTISGNIAIDGGGVFSDVSSSTYGSSNLDIYNSTFSNNSAKGSGGGVYSNSNATSTSTSSTSNSFSLLTIDYSTFNNNTATKDGGGIYANSYVSSVYSGIASARTSVELNTSTFSGNNSNRNGGAVFSNTHIISSFNTSSAKSDVRIRRSTLNNNEANSNGGGIYSLATSSPTPSSTSAVRVNGSIVDSSSIYNQYFNKVTSNGYNIFNDSPNGATGTGDQVNKILNLSPLAFNGGSTQTILPSVGSIAIDMGNPSDTIAAQNRSVSGGRRDIGAAETICSITATHKETVCYGDSIVVNGTTYKAGNLTGTEVFTNIGINKCDSTVTVALTILPELTGTYSETVCFGDSIVVNGTTYKAGLLNGVEVFTNVGANKCDSTVSVTLTILPELKGTYSETICYGDSIIVNGTTYKEGQLTGIEVFSNIGVNKCDSAVAVTLSILPKIDVTIDKSAMPSLSANLAGATYQWLDCDNGNAAISGATNQTYEAIDNGSYAVEITVGNCSATSVCEVVMGVGIEESTFGKRLKVYPNPTDGNFSVELVENHSSIKVTMIDLTGKLILSKEFNNTNLLNLKIEEPVGVYFLTIESANNKAVIRVVKE